MSQVITDVVPRWVVPGARVAVTGVHLPLPTDGPPHVLIGKHNAHVVAASRQGIRFVVPADVEGGSMPIRIDELLGDSTTLEVARILANGVHQVDSPIFDQLGREAVDRCVRCDHRLPLCPV